MSALLVCVCVCVGGGGGGGQYLSDLCKMCNLDANL